jgi:hypothetical protein
VFGDQIHQRHVFSAKAAGESHGLMLRFDFPQPIDCLTDPLDITHKRAQKNPLRGAG